MMMKSHKIAAISSARKSNYTKTFGPIPKRCDFRDLTHTHIHTQQK